MKKMDAITYCFIGLVLAFLISACERSSANPGASAFEPLAIGDKFRIPLEYGDGPTGPGGTPSNTPTWSDVADWQSFLKAMGTPYSTYLGAGYPNNTFDSATEVATKYYQLVLHPLNPKVPYPPNGIVETNTFAASGLVSKYTPVPGPPFSMNGASSAAKAMP